MLSNNEYFEYFIDFVKNNDKREILKEFGGANIYIPSYKTLLRDEELKQDFKTLIKEGLTTKMQVWNVLKIRFKFKCGVFNH